MKQAITVVVMVMIALCTVAFAQGDTADAALSQPAHNPVVLTPRIAKYNYDAMPKDPLASAMFSLIVPGLGQLYNKEYLRAGLTAVVFYGTFFGAQYLLNEYTAYNTDTFTIAEYSESRDTPILHDVTAPKPDKDQRWRSGGEKAAFIGCVVVAAGSWVFNVFDAYSGAKRYNAKLIGPVSFAPDPVRMSVSPDLNETGLTLHLEY